MTFPHLHPSRSDAGCGKQGDGTAKEIKQAAADAKTYGFVLNALSPADVMKLLDRSEVRSISIADVPFDLGYGTNR